MNELQELEDKISLLQEQIRRMSVQYYELSEHCKTMFELHLQNQETLSARISVMSERLHHHIMNL